MNILSIFLLFLWTVSFSIADSLKNFCKRWNGTWFQETSSCFILNCEENLVWIESQKLCETIRKSKGLKGRLAVIPTVDLFRNLTAAIFEKRKKNRIWIGLKTATVNHTLGTQNMSIIQNEWSWFDGDVPVLSFTWPRAENISIRIDGPVGDDFVCMGITYRRVGSGGQPQRWRLEDMKCSEKQKCRYCEFMEEPPPESTTFSRYPSPPVTSESTAVTVATSTVLTTTELSTLLSGLFSGTESPLQSVCRLNVSGIWSPSTQQCFSQLSNDSLTWRESYNRCASTAPDGFRGRLPVFPRPEVVQLLLPNANIMFWTALRTKSTPHSGKTNLSSDWKWYECDTVVGNLTWTPVEMGLNSEKEDCIFVTTTGGNKTTYDDAPCNSYEMKYFCEYLEAPPENTAHYCEISTTTTESPVTLFSRKTVSTRKTGRYAVKSTVLGATTKYQTGITGVNLGAGSTDKTEVSSDVSVEQTSDDTGDTEEITSTTEATSERITTSVYTENNKGSSLYSVDTEKLTKDVLNETSPTRAYGKTKETSSHAHQSSSIGYGNESTSITDAGGEAAATHDGGTRSKELPTDVTNEIFSTLSSFGESKDTPADADRSSPPTGYAMSGTDKETIGTTTDKPPTTSRAKATTTAKSLASTTPAFPMSEVEEAVAKVFQTLGCTFILGALSLTLGAFLLLRDFSYERFLHMNQEIALLIAHLLIMTARDETDMPVLCKLVSIVLHLTFMAAFNFLMLEALQTYAIMTSVVIRGGYFNRRQFFVIGWGGPALMAGVSALLMHDNYISHFSCWLNFDSRVAFATTVPICILFSAAFVMAEAASMGNYPKILGYDKNQATAAVANQKALFLLLPLNLASWLCGAIAVHYANFAMYSLVSALNMSLGIAIFVFHSLGNPKVHAVFKKLWSKLF